MTVGVQHFVLEEILVSFVTCFCSVEGDKDFSGFGLKFCTGYTDNLLFASFGRDRRFFERIGGFENGSLGDVGNVSSRGGCAVGGGRVVGFFGESGETE